MQRRFIKESFEDWKRIYGIETKYETKCCIPYTGMLYLKQRSIEVNITISEKGNGKGDCGKSRFVLDTVLNDARLTGLIPAEEVRKKFKVVMRDLENVLHRIISCL